MNSVMRDKWVGMLNTLEQQATSLKVQSLSDLPANRSVGCHQVTDGLAAIESLIWGLKDAVSRWPTSEDWARAFVDRDLDTPLLQISRQAQRLAEQQPVLSG